MLLSGVDLLDLGPRRLRDVSTPVGVFQVRAPGLRTEFPSLRALDTSPGNLRPAASSFIGRESELDEVQAAVNAHRLVTLTGVGGVGKTRLATEVAAQLADDFPDGVWVFELATVADPAAVPDAVAAVLGITQQPGKTVAESVAAALEGRLRLLVIDNCEHVLDTAADLIEAILAHSATVRILATSREGLGVADEQVWPVSSLDVGAGTDSAAVQLFVQRAHSVAPHFTPTREADAVVEICRRLDGIPLAIELAASRIASMSPGEVRDRLDDRFRLLIGSRRGLGRHQTLRHAVAWSYDLLDNAEKSLLAQCSVFAGSFDLQSACSVAGADDDYAILDLLDTLVRKSLLVVDRSIGQTRFSMLETIRQFAEEQLVALGAATEARAAHARYFAGREADVLAVWDSPRQREAYTWFTVELPNLRTAFRWAADHGDLDNAATIAFYSALLGIELEQHEPGGWAGELIEAARVVGHRRLAQLYSVASRCYEAGRIDEAVAYSEGGRAAVESGRFDIVPHEAESQLGGVYLWTGQPEQCVQWFQSVIARRSGASLYTKAGLALALQVAGAGDEARSASNGLLVAAAAAESPRLACWAYLAFGIVQRDTDPAAAHDALRRGLAIAQDSENRQLKSAIATTLALHAATYGDAVDAFDFVAMAIRNHYDSGSFSALRNPLWILAVILDRLEYYEPAATISEFAVGPMLRAANPEIDSNFGHLRDVLGDEAYESLARAGANMSNAAMVSYAFDQIDRARAQLMLDGESP